MQFRLPHEACSSAYPTRQALGYLATSARQHTVYHGNLRSGHTQTAFLLFVGRADLPAVSA